MLILMSVLTIIILPLFHSLLKNKPYYDPSKGKSMLLPVWLRLFLLGVCVCIFEIEIELIMKGLNL